MSDHVNQADLARHVADAIAAAREQGRREGLEQAARAAEEHEGHVDFENPQDHTEPPYRCSVAAAIRALRALP